MKILILSDGETWETFNELSDAMVVELNNVDEYADIDEIEQAIDAETYEIVDYLWDKF